MTRMFLFSCILTSGFLFQALKNRPPEMVYEEVPEISSEGSTQENPTIQKASNQRAFSPEEHRRFIPISPRQSLTMDT